MPWGIKNTLLSSVYGLSDQGRPVNRNRVKQPASLPNKGGTKFMQKFAKSGGRTKREVFIYSYVLHIIMASAQYLLHGSWGGGGGRPSI
jgi:hypothetical protein